MQKIHKMSDYSQFIRTTCDWCGKEEEFPPVGKGYFTEITQQRWDNCQVYLKEKGWLPFQQIDDKPVGLGERRDFCCQECYEQFMKHKKGEK